jgi:hypothetical protein
MDFPFRFSVQASRSSSTLNLVWLISSLPTLFALIGPMGVLYPFPFRFSDTHEHFRVFDRNPAGEDFHDILEVGLKNDPSSQKNPLVIFSGPGFAFVLNPQPCLVNFFTPNPFDRNPAGEDFHDILEVGLKNDFTHAVNKGSR